MAVKTPTKRPPATLHPVDDYAHAVVGGRIVTGKLVRQACERHLRDLETGSQRGLWFDYNAASGAIKFFAQLQHTKGEWAGNSLQLELWQSFIVGSMFGWKRTNGLRRFRTVYTECARKQGKSLLAAGIGLKLAFFDGEPGAEVYSASTKREQSKIVWGDAKQIVIKTPSLASRIRTLTANMHMESTNSKFEPLGADEDSTDGLNIHGAIIDELHAHKTRKLWDVIETATGARRQPLTFVITTAGSDPLSICGQQHEYAEKVLDGTVEDDSYFAYIAAIDEEDAWDNPDVWIKANPNLGVSVKLDDLQNLCNRAKEMPAAVAAFKRLRCGVWTEAESPWLDMAIWDASNVHPINPEDYLGQHCYAGLDLSKTTDITARVLLFDCPQDNEAKDLIAQFWVPSEALPRRVRNDRVPYDVWHDQGWIALADGPTVDYALIEDDVNALSSKYQVVEVAYDPWNATHIAQRLQADGATMVEIRQGFGSLSEPTKNLEKLLLGKKLHHGGNPVLRWMASNVVIQMDAAGNIKPAKDKSREKIDGIIATIMALSRALQYTELGSVYDTQEIFVI